MECGPQVQCVLGLAGWDHKDLMDAEGWQWMVLGGQYGPKKAMCKGQNYDWTIKFVVLVIHIMRSKQNGQGQTVNLLPKMVQNYRENC